MNTNNEISEFLNLLLAGNRLKSSEYAKQYFSQNQSVLNLYENLLKKTMYAVGDLWEQHQISVASEHLASALVEIILNEQYALINSTKKYNKTALLATVQNELHQIGIKMISDVFELNGWNTYFLGSNTPTADLLSFAKVVKPDILALSISISEHFSVLEAMLQEAKNTLPNTILLIGGQAFTRDNLKRITNLENVLYMPDVYAVDSYLKKINSQN